MIVLSPITISLPIILIIEDNYIQHSIHIDNSLKETVRKKIAKEVKVVQTIDQNGNDLIIIPLVKNEKHNAHTALEHIRCLGSIAYKIAQEMQLQEVLIIAENVPEESSFAFTEGFALSNYKFNRFKSKNLKTIEQIHVAAGSLTPDAVATLNNIIQAVFYARNIVNEPLMALNARQLSQSAADIAQTTGIRYEELGAEKIKALKMGGVLGVNQGSAEAPTFTILEWKPQNAVNQQPVVLVGKGVVYDTGGYSIKTGDGMMTMKCDMGGAAAVFGGIYLAALEKLPLHIITLVPAVENRINEKALVPGDILTISDGTTVEVLNTDAEGRLILADALVYARQFDPALVLDFATLTGAAMRAIGSNGAAYMGTADSNIKTLAVESGYTTHERVAELPLWEDYAEQLKSEVADISNLGGPLAGASTAGRFLQHFTNYPWLHFDIAGPAFLSQGSSYRPAGGTGTGVRFILDFLKRYTQSCQQEEKS